MELDKPSLEDGELSEDDVYKPLERPANFSAAPNRFPKVETESEGELQTTSGSDSDSDADVFVAKKSKVSVRAPAKKPENKRKKYDIWSTRVHDDLLSETLVSCNVTQRDMSRNVESYDYPLNENYECNRLEREDGKERSVKDRVGYETKGRRERRMETERSNSGNRGERSNSRNRGEKDGRTNNKRRHFERKDKSLKLVNRKEEKNEKGESRFLNDMVLGADADNHDFAVELATHLFEEKEELIEKVVNVMGKEKVLEIYDEVKKIEADGGMFLMNHMRRRTPGGVFLFLVRHDSDLTKEQNSMIFEADRQNYKQFLKAKKKARLQQIKNKIISERTTNLPQLLNRAELEQKLNSDAWTSGKESDQEEVTNPPPTPETDGHGDSGDGLDAADTPQINNSYESDFLDINTGNDMDLF